MKTPITPETPKMDILIYAYNNMHICAYSGQTKGAPQGALRLGAHSGSEAMSASAALVLPLRALLDV